MAVHKYLDAYYLCDDCYVERRHLFRKNPDDLPKCLGPGKCPSGGNHDGNDLQNKSLGCEKC